MKPLILVCSCLLLLVAVPGRAQTGAPAGSYLESLQVRLVNVGVVVTDKSGAAVTDLGIGDFELREDGKKVKISHFQAPRSGAAGSGGPAAEGGTDALQGYVVVLVDNLAIRPQSRLAVLEGAREFIESQVGAASSNVEFAVASYDGYLRIRQSFTRDRDALVAALQELERLSPLGIARQAERGAVLRDSLQTLVGIQRLALDPGRDTETSRNLASYTAAINAYAEQVHQETGQALYALSHMVNALGALPGSKALVYVSEGLPMRPGDELLQVALDVGRDLPVVGDGQEAREASITNRSAQLGALSDSSSRRRRQVRQGTDAPPGLHQLTATANANRVTFYALKSAGHQGGVPPELGGDIARLYTPSVQSAREANLLETLQVMAGETGGEARVGTRIEGLLERASADLGDQYTLAFAPEHPVDGELHELEVKVKRKGVRVRSRKSYIDKTVAARIADRATTSLLLGIDDNPHGVSLQIGQVRQAAKEDEVEVALVVHIPLRDVRMLESAGVHSADTQLFVAARDTRGDAAPVQGLALRIEVERSLEEAPDQVFSGQLPLTLKRVSQRVGLAFVDPATGLASFVSADLELASEPGP